MSITVNTDMAIELEVEYDLEPEIKLTSVMFGGVEILDALGDHHLDEIEQKILEKI